MNDNSRFVPWIVVGVAAFILGIIMVPPGESAEQMNVYDFGTIPVIDGGRTKPFDTFARTTLFAISDRQKYVDDTGHSHEAVEWALDVMSNRPGPDGRTPACFDHAIFYISNDQVLHDLHLRERSGLRYSFREIYTGVMKEDADDPSVQPHAENIPNLRDAAEKAEGRDASQRELHEFKTMELARNLDRFLKLQHHQTPLMVPTSVPSEDWATLGDSLLEDNSPDPNRPMAKSLMMMLNAYSLGRQDAFNPLVVDYKTKLTNSISEKENRRLGFEVFFNHVQAFYICAVLYVLVFLMACVSWIAWQEPLRRSAFWLGMLTLLVHAAALLARMYLLDRPLVFVTNLYSSAIFIGCGAVALCLLIERIFPYGISLAVGAIMGALTLLLAQNIATGDTLEMMQAVLDTNLWLATHVTCVTIGYLATFVAGFFGIAYIIAGVFTRLLNRDFVKIMGQMMYGVICFAMMFSFVGTVLGGIWADQSWGRFWGWDPKENGALLIVIWNALILHARWAGMVQQRGMAVLAVAGNIVTTWSWFGTNMLGVGLHSYGFTQGALFWLLFFITTQLIMIAVGSMPLRMWTSFALAPKRDEEDSPPAARGKRNKRGKKGSSAVQPA